MYIHIYIYRHQYTKVYHRILNQRIFPSIIGVLSKIVRLMMAYGRTNDISRLTPACSIY